MINSQSLASVVRQFLAVLGIIFMVLTQSDSSLHLPVAASSILGIIGGIILALEHYVGDPSTGTVTTDTPNGPVPIVPVHVDAATGRPLPKAVPAIPSAGTTQSVG